MERGEPVVYLSSSCLTREFTPVVHAVRHRRIFIEPDKAGLYDL